MNNMYSSEKLLRAIGEIDESLVCDAFNDTEKRKRQLKWGSLAAALALCAGAFIVIGGILKTGSREAGTPEASPAGNSVVILDVNPSIALTVNADEKIAAADGLNEDGKAVLRGMDLTEADLTAAVSEIMNSMLQKGYLSDLQNAILVSVEDNDTGKSTELQKRVSSVIAAALQEGNLGGTVFSQTFHVTPELEQLAQNYGISLGKAALIQEAASGAPSLTTDDLALLSIPELELLTRSQDPYSEILFLQSIAEGRTMISQESAVEIALEHAGVDAVDTDGLKTALDSRDEITVYKVEFHAGEIIYEYDIDAHTGRVVNCASEKETVD